ncbi:MAG: glycosyltransferase family 4 protein [Terrimicrobiaceae bacterium]
MKIGLSVSVIQKGKSGVATYVAGLLRGLAANDWPVEVVLFGLEEDRPWFAPWLDHCQWVGVPETFRPAVANIAWHQAVLPGRLRRRGCDVVHIPSYRRMVALPGIPQVVTVHDCAPFRLQGKYDRFRMFYGRQMVTRLARRTQEVIAVSQTTAEDIREFFGVRPESLSVIYNGIDHARFRPQSPEQIRRQLPVTAGWEDGWWIYVARVEHPGKNHLRLLEAFERLCAERPREAGRLVLAGADWHGAEVVHRAIAESPVRDRIHCAGFVPEEDLPAWYSGAKGLIFPSLFEGFGLPPVEAMACGCPVLCSDRGSLKEVTGGAAVLFDPEDTGEIVRAMSGLCRDPAQQGALRTAGLARAAEFEWGRCAAETVAIYHRAAGNALTARRQNPSIG